VITGLIPICSCVKFMEKHGFLVFIICRIIIGCLIMFL
jgi:undecaprenyl pyrophosphate phosphatase UppP